jgi:hypothetical protein
MSASNRANHVYLVMDGGSPVAAFAHKHAKRTYLRRRYGTFNSPFVYTFGGEQGYTPAIMTMSAAPADGRAVNPSGYWVGRPTIGDTICNKHF